MINTKSNGRKFAKEYIEDYTPTFSMLLHFVRRVRKEYVGHNYFVNEAIRVVNQELSRRGAGLVMEPVWAF